MTEQEWLASNDPKAMLRLVEKTSTEGLVIAIPRQPSFRVSNRKLRLFACACCRQIWHLLIDKQSREAVETAERYADGLATEEDLWIARNMAWDTSTDVAWQAARNVVMEIARDAVWSAAYNTASIVSWNTSMSATWKQQSILLRDIVGNPFHTVNIPNHWLTPHVVALAKVAYKHRPGEKCTACMSTGWYYDSVGENTTLQKECLRCHGDGYFEDGLLNPYRLAVLSDAVEEAGCDNAEILNHLRSPGPHVRGCWVLDLLIGKE